MTTERMDDTDINIDDNTTVIETPIYEFQLSESTSDDYKCCTLIIEWIKGNLENLTDDNGSKIFSKVNYGYNTETIKGFGKKPVADVYIDNLDYATHFDNNYPESVNSFIICYLKGNMNTTYVKACELTDYLIQQFEENESFRELSPLVKYTSVENVEIQIIPSTKTYGVLCAFELEHKLY